MASLGLPNIVELAQLGIYVVGAYEGYIYLTKGQSIIPNDPIQKAIQDLVKAVYPPPVTCDVGFHLSNGVCVADGSPPPTTCDTGYHLVNGVCVADTIPAGTDLIKTVTLTSPLPGYPQPLVSTPSSFAAGSGISVGGIIPAGVAVTNISAKLLSGTSESFVSQNWVTVVPEIIIQSPPSGAWHITLPIPSTLAAGNYLVAVAMHDPANKGFFPWVWVTVTSSTVPPPTTCNAGFHLANGVCVPNTTPPTGDTTPPLIGLTAFSGTVTGSTTVIHGSMSDNVAVTSAQVSMDGGPWTAVHLLTATTFDATYTSIAPGVHSFRARAFDAAGNMGESNVISTTFLAGPTGGGTDTTPPAVAILSPANGAAVSGTTVVVTGTASDAVGVTLVQVREKLGAPAVWVNATPTGSGYSSWSATITLAAGISAYTLEAYARDAAGNENWSNDISITKSSGVPAGTPIITLNKPNYNLNEIITVTATGFQGGEVVGCRFTIEGALVLAKDVQATAGGAFTTTFTASTLGGGHITCTGRTSNAVGQSSGFNVVASGAFAMARYGRSRRAGVAIARTRLGHQYNRNPYDEMAIAYR